MDRIVGLTHKLLDVLAYLSNDFNNIVSKYLILYWSLYFGFAIVLTIYDIIIFFSRDKLSSLFKYLLNSSNSIQTMNFWSQSHYLFDKFLTNRSLGIVSYGGFIDNNNFRRHANSGPIAFINFFKSLIMIMFTISIKNLIIWSIIYLFFHSELLNHYNPSVAIHWDFFLNKLKSIDFKTVYENLNIIYVLVIGTTGYKFYMKSSQKIEQDAYDKVIPLIDELRIVLGEIIHVSSDNIDRFYEHLKFLPSEYCELITKSNKYNLYNGKLNSSERHYLTTTTMIEEISERYTSFQDNFKKFIETLNKIHDENLWPVFRKTNKNVMYEIVRLSLYSPKLATYLEGNLLNKESIILFLNGWTDEKFLKQKFEKIHAVESGYLNKEDLLNRYNYKITFEEIVRYAEQDLEKKAIEFQSMAKYRLIEAIGYYVLVEQLLSKIRVKQSRAHSIMSVLPFGDSSE